MEVVQLNDSRKHWKLFHRVPHLVYRHTPHWVCPLERDVEGVFNPRKNKAFANGEARRWVLLDENGQPAGRIAAFINHEKNKTRTFPLGGIGYFECFDREDAALALLNTAEAYLREKGAQAIDGPINFGERDKFWGLLTKGHEFRPLYQENYQPPYYRKFFETWGARPFDQILTLRGVVKDVPIRPISYAARRLERKYQIRTVKCKGMPLRKVARDFATVYNAAFRQFDHYNPISAEAFYKLIRMLRPIADWHMLSITYIDDQPIGFSGFVPDLNPFLRHVRGKLSWWRLPGFLLRLKLSRQRSLKGIVFGIDADYQNQGIFSHIVDALYDQHTLDYYQDFFLATIRGHNKVMIKTIQRLGVNVQRVHLTFRKMLDAQLPFEPNEFYDIID